MRRNHENGFTLIEMSMVIGVLGIALTIAVVGTVRLVRTSRLAGATNTLVADIRYARVLATTERKNVQILFESGGYSILRVTPPDTVLRRVCPTGVSCTSGGPANFYAWGLTDPLTITLASAERSNVLQLAANGNVSRD